MSSALDRRLAALERETGARRVQIRAYYDEAELQADSEPAPPGVDLLRIITGVPRAPDWPGWD
jgi:hypothetical protein